MTATTTPHLRDLLDTPQPYSQLVREERNFAALLYAELLHRRGLAAFLELIGWKEPVDNDQVGVYFEYAHLRDLWVRAGTRKDIDVNAAYRHAVAALVSPPAELFESLSGTKAFNQYFLGEGRVSSTQIQMPSRWNQKQFAVWRGAYEESDPERARGTAFARRCCGLKWAFNAKPDIVIHLSPTQAICLEIKYESAESRYQVKTGEDASEATWSQSQTQVQRYVLQEVLGYQTTFVFLSRTKRARRNAGSTADSEQRGEPVDITWEEVHRAVKLGPAAQRNEDLPFAQYLWALAAAPTSRGAR